MLKIFKKILKKKKETAILMMDSYRSHCSENILQILGGNNIIVYTFPSYASNLFHPCDLSLFGSLKMISEATKRKTNENQMKNYIKPLI